MAAAGGGGSPVAGTPQSTSGTGLDNGGLGLHPALPQPGVPSKAASRHATIRLTDVRSRLGRAKGANAVALGALLVMMAKDSRRSLDVPGASRDVESNTAPPASAGGAHVGAGTSSPRASSPRAGGASGGHALGGEALERAAAGLSDGGGGSDAAAKATFKSRRFRKVAELLVTAQKELDVRLVATTPPNNSGVLVTPVARQHAGESGAAGAGRGAFGSASANGGLPPPPPQALLSPSMVLVAEEGSSAKLSGDGTTSAKVTIDLESGGGAGVSKDSGRGEREEGEGDDNEEEEEEEEHDHADGVDFTWPTTLRARLLYLLTLPIMFLFAYTIPNVHQPFWARTKLFGIILSFAINIFWLGALSYLSIWWALEIGTVAMIPDVVMGYTLLALGTSIPDLSASILVARQGLGDMAVACTVGSNIFDITLGLPLPWFFWSLGYGRAFHVSATSVGFSLILILFILAAFLSSIALLKWKMPKSLGGILLAIYAVFLALVIPNEVGVFEVPF